MKSTFSRFFILLLAAELSTVLIALLLLDGATRFWVYRKATSLAAILPQVAKKLDWTSLSQIRPNDTPATSPAYKASLQTIVDAEKQYFGRGNHLSVVVIKGDKEAYIVQSSDTDDQQSMADDDWFNAESYAIEAAQDKVSYSPYPYKTNNGTENITAYAPIHDSTGAVKALLSVDYDTGSLADTQQIVRWSFLLSIVPAVLISVLLAAFLSKRFVDPMDFLRRIHELTPRPSSTDSTPTPRTADGVLEESGNNLVTVTPPEQRESTEPVVDSKWATLTQRERETATLSFLKQKEIAERMGITVEGVKKHSQNARAKLGARDKVELALYAVQMGALKKPLPEGGIPDESP